MIPFLRIIVAHFSPKWMMFILLSVLFSHVCTNNIVKVGANVVFLYLASSRDLLNFWLLNTKIALQETSYPTRQAIDRLFKLAQSLAKFG